VAVGGAVCEPEELAHPKADLVRDPSGQSVNGTHCLAEFYFIKLSASAEKNLDFLISGPNPTIASYNASVVNFTTPRVPCFEIKNISLR
jgi:hypothetical protein